MLDKINRPSFLHEADLQRLVDFRHALHRMPELSGEEEKTARAVVDFLRATAPDEIVTGLGGHGVAAVYAGSEPGPIVLFRSELDALPIQELTNVPYRSTVAGKGHLCGHDGHSATLAALGLGFAQQRPRRGRAVLMFQPAEENGAGAAAVVADPKFAAIAPDIAFSWHNMPGLPFGAAVLGVGPVNCASRGMRITLIGKTSHASQPEMGLSPAPAVAGLLMELTALSTGLELTTDFAMATITHCRMGEPVFGIAPGEAEIFVTLRTLTDGRMGALVARAEEIVGQHAAVVGLGLTIAYDADFAHVENAPEAVAHLQAALAAEGIAMTGEDLPMRGSEDFGRFGRMAPAAMVFIGAGEMYPSLHNPDYDFPDGLIDIAARVMMRTAREILG